MTVLKILFAFVIIIPVIIFITIYRNDANLFDAPGFKARLDVYLSSNVAATAEDHVFEELRTPVFNTNADELYKRTIRAAADLGWQVFEHDSDDQNAHFIVYSPMFLFKDDVYVQIGFIDMDRSKLSVRSASQLGRTDFGANAGHIRDLIKALKRSPAS